MIVLVESHFEVEADKLCEMAMRVRVFGAENGRNLKDAVHVRADGHLLVQLRRLRKVRVRLEVRHLEHVRAALADTPRNKHIVSRRNSSFFF